MNKSELTERLAIRMGMCKALSRDAVDGVFGTIGEALTRGDDVRIAGFGTFGARNRPARTGRNSHTGETVEIGASKAPTFKPGKLRKDAVMPGGVLRTGDGGRGTRNAGNDRHVEAARWR